MQFSVFAFNVRLSLHLFFLSCVFILQELMLGMNVKNLKKKKNPTIRWLNKEEEEDVDKQTDEK